MLDQNIEIPRIVSFLDQDIHLKYFELIFDFLAEFRIYRILQTNNILKRINRIFILCIIYASL